MNTRNNSRRSDACVRLAECLRFWGEILCNCRLCKAASHFLAETAVLQERRSEMEKVVPLLPALLANEIDLELRHELKFVHVNRDNRTSAAS